MAETTTATTQTGWLSSFAKGEFPSVPVSMSLDSATIISITAIALILIVVVIIFKRS
jgi:hypothetical protein